MKIKGGIINTVVKVLAQMGTSLIVQEGLNTVASCVDLKSGFSGKVQRASMTVAKLAIGFKAVDSVGEYVDSQFTEIDNGYNAIKDAVDSIKKEESNDGEEADISISINGEGSEATNS